MSRLSRRTALRLGAGALGGLAAPSLAGTLFHTAGAVAAPPPGDPAPPAVASPTFLSGSFTSLARGGVETRWAMALPPGQSAALPTVIALHGKDADAASVMAMGVEAALAAVVQAGSPPFAVVAVDGGNGYWHRRITGEDAGTMVLHELLPMLTQMGMDTSRVGFLGWSMGGYGAMLLGGLLGPARTSAICAVSPALYTSYDEAVRVGAFDSSADWARYSVFGADALSTIPLRVDCGRSDRFYPASRSFVASLRRPPAGVSYPGGHDIAGWRHLLPTNLAWLASQALPGGA